MVDVKSVFKLTSVIIITSVVVFICTTFVSYPLDLRAIEHLVTSSEAQAAYLGAQVSLADVIIIATVGLFGSIAVLILMFSIRQFINENSAELGVLKALGYSENRLAITFSKFGLSVFVGSVVGYLLAFFASPVFYGMLTSDYELPATVVFIFRYEILIIMIAIPTLFFMALAVLYARLRLGRKPLELIRGANDTKVSKLTQKLQNRGSKQPFLKELKRNVLLNNLALVFFIGFAAFTFAAQVQTAFTVRQLLDNMLLTATFVISGQIVGSVTLLLALTFIIGKNKQYVAMLKAYGYTGSECGKAMFGGYRIVTYVGFATGTFYQYLFIAFIIARAFDNARIEFDIAGFFISLSVFVLAYELIMVFYKKRISSIPLREIMQTI
jgi:hypothetical protein